MAGMNGMEMLMKSFGIDPKEIQANVELFKAETLNKIQAVDDRLKNIEMQNSNLLEQQSKMIVAMEAMYSASVNKVLENATQTL